MIKNPKRILSLQDIAKDQYLRMLKYGDIALPKNIAKKTGAANMSDCTSDEEQSNHLEEDKANLPNKKKKESYHHKRCL